MKTKKLHLDLFYRYAGISPALVASCVFNDRWFRGALVVLVERNRDPAGRPFIGDTFLDGLTAAECDDATRRIGGPPGRRLDWPKPRNRVRF